MHIGEKTSKTTWGESKTTYHLSKSFMDNT
jgi:hypothetical protein